VLRALRVAREMGLVTIGFTGENGGEMRELADHLLEVPSRTTARIQEMHIMLGQTLCAVIERKLGLVEE
jgi:D-sedoheptulose 7-phosphate isomerase